MAIPVIMPRQGQSVESCIITKWHKQVGDKVALGDLLFSYETDKAAFDYEAEAEGTLLVLLHQEGDDVPCLENVCVLGAAGEDFSTFTGAAPAAAPVTTAPAATAAPAAASAAANTAALPASVNIVIMPRQGQSVESCIVSKWHKQPGDTVKIGELLFSYETDKASFDYEAEVEGTLLKILGAEGDDVPCLDPICLIGPAGTDVSGYTAAPAAAPAVGTAPVAVQAVPVAAPVTAAPIAATNKISPRARHTAERLGVDIRYATPTGAEDRIIERDVFALRDAGRMINKAAEAAYLAKGEKLEGTGIGGRVSTADLSAPAKITAPAPAAPAAAASIAAPAADYTDEKLPNIRKVIAKSMVASLTTMAQLTHTASFDATNMMQFRADLKKNGEALDMSNITLNDIILYAVSRVLKDHRDLNAHLLNGDTMRYFNNVNLGIAVDTPRGLLVPTLFHADTMSLTEIAAQAKALAKSAQAGSISPELLKGGTFTISNLGSLGIESFTPVINPPQTGILGVNTLQTRVREVEGELKAYQAMTLSLTYDHRALDGAPASRFLKELCIALENFTLFLAK